MTLDKGEHVLGRDPNVQIYLDAPGVSRRQAVIKIAAGRATIEDLGSKNALIDTDGEGASDAEHDRDRTVRTVRC